MTRDDRYTPLWADSLADQPRPDVIARVLEEPEDDPPPRPGEHEPADRRTLVLGALGALVVLAVAIALHGQRALTVEDVPSGWNDIPMTCHTVRLEQDDERSVEWFECRALAGESLPPGLYSSPGSEWTSDITRRRARENRMRISPDGTLVGWARYTSDGR